MASTRSQEQRNGAANGRPAFFGGAVPQGQVAKPSSRIVGIELARGVAAILVIFYHTSRHIDQAYRLPWLRVLFQFGHSGVDLFFVISGFVITFVHFNDIGCPERLARYAGRRATRILPTYWAALAVTVALATLGSHPHPMPQTLALQSVFLPSDEPMILGVAWTLNYEATFYLLFAMLIAHRTTGLALFGAWFGFVAFCAVSGWHVPTLPDRFQSAYVLEFGVGMAVAAVARRNATLPSLAILGLGIAGFAFAAGFEDCGLLDGYADWARLAYGSASALAVLGLVSLPAEVPIARQRLLGLFGSASYSLYIFQFVFIGTAWQALIHTGLAARLPPLAQFAVLATAAIVGGVLAARYVERPLIRACRSIGRWAPV